MRDNCLTIRENTRLGGDMTGLGSELAANAGQPRRKGQISGRISALEAAYEGYRANSSTWAGALSPGLKITFHSYTQERP
jgi:hypothetical protein